jgi:hypothetical protein
MSSVDVLVAGVVLTGLFGLVIALSKLGQRNVYYQTRWELSGQPQAFPSRLGYLLSGDENRFPAADVTHEEVLAEIAGDPDFEGSLSDALLRSDEHGVRGDLPTESDDFGGDPGGSL